MTRDQTERLARILTHGPERLEPPEPARPEAVQETGPPPAKAGARARQAFRQLSVLTRRYFRVKVRDTTGMLAALGQVPLIVLGCWLVLQQTLERKGALVVPGALPFILVVSAYWLGCANAVREIVTDQAILKRERLAGLGLWPYVISKLAVLLGLMALQCTLLMGTAELFFGLGARHMELLRALPVLALVGFFGTALGLCVSASCKSSEAAVAVLPGLVIPQLLFGGLLVPFDQMPEMMRWISYVMASRWGMDGLLQSGASGIQEGVVHRELATLLSVPGGEAVPRDWFLKMLGLAQQSSAYGPAAPEWSWGQAVAALAGLVVLASFAIGGILKLRRT